MVSVCEPIGRPRPQGNIDIPDPGGGTGLCSPPAQAVGAPHGGMQRQASGYWTSTFWYRSI